MIAKISDNHSTRLAAFHNVNASIKPGVVLPQQVFLGRWHQFLFFPSDAMFEKSFPDSIKDFLYAEQATSCCLLNFRLTTVMEYQTAATIYLEETLTGGEYRTLLGRNDVPPGGWIVRMDDYGCASDKGEWCIYCEKGNEVAVIGFRFADGVRKFSIPLAKLGAESIKTLIGKGSSALFPYNELVESWRMGLVKHYAEGT